MIKIEQEFYQNDNYYNQDLYGDYEKDIINYIKKYKLSDYDKIIEKDKRTNIVSVFSENRVNVIKWYPFDPNKTLLEIGANYGEITQELVKKCGKVTAIEFTKNKAYCLSKRLENFNNVDLILCTNLKNLELNKKYDYITIIGTAEYAKILGFSDLNEMLKWANNHLENDGKIFLAIDNKFGAKYLAGSTRNKEEVPFANYKTYIEKSYKFYGKNELENILKHNDLKYKFYYPVPNYSLTHLIYTDSYLPKQNRYNIYYREDEEILFNELTFMEEASKNNSYDLFTNSYLIEISKSENNISDVCFVNYSNMRKSEYKILTKISKNVVVKEAFRKEGIPHINKIEKNIKKLRDLGFEVCENVVDNKVISNYISKPTMDEYVYNLIKQGNKEKFDFELDKWYNFLKQNISVGKEKENFFRKYGVTLLNNKLTFLEDGFVDLVFQNVFYDGNEYIVFDQEWYEEDVPLEYIMYRSIKQLFFQHEELEKIIDKKEIYLKYNIDKYINEFDIIEENWQKRMVNDAVYSFYEEKWSRIISIEDIKFKFNQELGKVYTERDKLNEEIECNEKRHNEQLESIKIQNRKLVSQCEQYSKELERVTNQKNKLQDEVNGLKSRKFYKIANFLRGNKDE